ncbi:membrane glycoprotein US6 [Human betaherpesvirus 5]|uniref:Membrane glycoprotein US6 n=1 Tax=Human cytomegalovirus TaxID=10359 RepID=D2K536_HCMV|nr:membrane glycoprotein US6 [Human betaherpesvirus 5]AFR56464.1 membrane glycoprotein US6 [Human betaherpesvirus 5]AHB19946.1 membrane glycoprotein US6 [Human betaherpesvirus 5]AHJ82022.1 membrane glycoprotein US6 [Human betaherpesvirus 5]APA45874.1 membrane glycoprotein US6 [Human betaherpesvirus 5]
MDLLIRLGFLLMCALPTPGERSSRDPKTLLSLSPRQQACLPRTKSHRPICYNDTGDCTDADDSWKQLGEDFAHQCLLAAKKRPKTHKSRPNDRNLEGRLTCQRVSRLLPCDLDIHPSHRLLTLMNNCVCDGAVWNAFRLIERHGFFAVTLYLCCGITLLVVILALLCSITYESTGRGIRRCGS